MNFVTILHYIANSAKTVHGSIYAIVSNINIKGVTKQKNIYLSNKVIRRLSRSRSPNSFKHCVYIISTLCEKIGALAITVSSKLCKNRNV